MHLMIDLETLGTDTDCVVTQIGYCLFDIENEKLYFSDELHLDPQEQIDVGRKTNWKTLQWWNEQSEEARTNMFGEGGVKLKLTPAIDLFETNVRDKCAQKLWSNIEGVWSNGLTFDVAIMSSLYKLIGHKEPWHFRTPRDTRTIWSIVPKGLISYHKPALAHSAMSDAICQAKNVQLAYRCLTQNLIGNNAHPGEVNNLAIR